MLLLSAEAAFKPGGPFFGEFTSENLSQGFIPGRPSLAYKGCGYSIFCTELSVGIIGIYGIGSHASYPHIHELLLHADTVLQAYTVVESLEREVFDERYAVYLYVVDLRTELDGLCFLASYNGTYIMTVSYTHLTAACFSENAGLSLLSGLLPPAIMLMQTGLLLSPGS